MFRFDPFEALRNSMLNGGAILIDLGSFDAWTLES